MPPHGSPLAGPPVARSRWPRRTRRRASARPSRDSRSPPSATSSLAWLGGYPRRFFFFFGAAPQPEDLCLFRFLATTALRVQTAGGFADAPGDDPEDPDPPGGAGGPAHVNPAGVPPG